MPEELMIEHCSPTMAGLKTANLFACSGEDAGELNASIRDLNRRWTERGVCVIPVKQDAERTLIYMYRPERLAGSANPYGARHFGGAGLSGSRCQTLCGGADAPPAQRRIIPT